MPPRDDENYEDLLRGLVFDAATVRAIIASVPFQNYTYAFDPAVDGTEGTVVTPQMNSFGSLIVTQSDGSTTSFPMGCTLTTGTTTADSGNITVIIDNEPESPFNEPFARRLREQFGVDRQDIDLPEGVEMLKECRIESTDKEKKEVTLEFRIKGPTIPTSVILLLEKHLQFLDLEIKRAMIRAFRLIPTQELRKRTIIVDDEE